MKPVMEPIVEDESFYTMTMAKVHESQGNYGSAAKIYRHLLEKDPDAQNLADALADIKEQISIEKKDGMQMIVGKWVDLIIKIKNIRQLHNLFKKNKLNH